MVSLRDKGRLMNGLRPPNRWKRYLRLFMRLSAHAIPRLVEPRNCNARSITCKRSLGDCKGWRRRCLDAWSLSVDLAPCPLMELWTLFLLGFGLWCSEYAGQREDKEASCHT